MTAAVSAAGADGLRALRDRPAGAVLAFDFDGTLAPIVSEPALARAHSRVVPLLARLAPRVAALAIVTGRPAAVAVEYGGFADVAGLVVLGQYGLERWEAGKLTVPPPPPGVAVALAELPRLLNSSGAPAEVWVEDNGGQSLTVHARRCADPRAALDRLHGGLAALAARTGLVVEPGRLVLELRPPGMDKGRALRAFVDAVTPAGSRPSAVLYAGDDLGDLAAYDAVDALRSEGVPGVKLCSGSAEATAPAERADLVVDGPAGVVAFLADLL